MRKAEGAAIAPHPELGCVLLLRGVYGPANIRVSGLLLLREVFDLKFIIQVLYRLSQFVNLVGQLDLVLSPRVELEVAVEVEAILALNLLYQI